MTAYRALLISGKFMAVVWGSLTGSGGVGSHAPGQMEKWRLSLGKHSLINASGVIRTALPLRHSTRGRMTSPMFHVASAPIRRATPHHHPTLATHRRHPTRHVHLQRPGLPRPTGMNTTTHHNQGVGAGPVGQITGPLLADLLRCITPNHRSQGFASRLRCAKSFRATDDSSRRVAVTTAEGSRARTTTFFITGFQHPPAVDDLGTQLPCG